jgi:hypothetical protein
VQKERREKKEEKEERKTKKIKKGIKTSEVQNKVVAQNANQINDVPTFFYYVIIR